MAAHGGFFLKENIIILEARSLLCAVRFAESDNLALVLAHFSYVSYFCAWF